MTRVSNPCWEPPTIMNPLDVPLSCVPHDQLAEHVRRLKEYIHDTIDPNRPGHDGQTCLRLALAYCNDEGGEDRIASLLERAADPNRPNAFVYFQTYIMVAKRTEPLAMLIKAGLRLNDVYTIDPAYVPTCPSGRITLLDYVLDAEAYLNRRSKGFIKFAEKHAGPLTGRRRFLADTIALLKVHGAVRAEPG